MANPIIAMTGFEPAGDLTMGVNARGCFLMSRAVVPTMRKPGWGRRIAALNRPRRTGRHKTIALVASMLSVNADETSLAA